jgi:hypothetical protein
MKDSSPSGGPPPGVVERAVGHNVGRFGAEESYVDRDLCAFATLLNRHGSKHLYL